MEGPHASGSAQGELPVPHGQLQAAVHDDARDGSPLSRRIVEWEGDIDRASDTGPRPKLRLLQLDVAVKDPRANSTTGWVFGTFQYEKAASTSANWWDHLVPVGLMWGSDVTSLKANKPTTQEWINSDRGQKLHLGRKDQVLNGPIDNPLGSCTACHGFAQIAA